MIRSDDPMIRSDDLGFDNTANYSIFCKLKLHELSRTLVYALNEFWLILFLEITIVSTIFDSVSLWKFAFDFLLQQFLIVSCFRHGAFAAQKLDRTTSPGSDQLGLTRIDLKILTDTRTDLKKSQKV